MTKEIEIKLKINDLPKLVQKLKALNVDWGSHYFQTTIGFFSKDSIEKGIFPRIRNENGEIIMTVKVRPENKSRYFERNEYSLKILKMKDGVQVLNALGFDKTRTFIKSRQEITYKQLKMALDRLYFGNFLEIEGSKKNVKKMAEKLGFKETDWITKAYLALEDNYLKNKNRK